MRNRPDAVMPDAPDAPMGPLDEAIWRMGTVRERTGMGKNTILRRVEAGQFPRPVRIGERAIGWLASEVTAWIRSRPRAGMAEIRGAGEESEADEIQSGGMSGGGPQAKRAPAPRHSVS